MDNFRLRRLANCFSVFAFVSRPIGKALTFNPLKCLIGTLCIVVAIAFFIPKSGVIHMVKKKKGKGC